MLRQSHIVRRRLQGPIGAIALVLGAPIGVGAETIGNARVLPLPDLARPALLQPITDPLFGTGITRITDPGGESVDLPCAPTHCRHRYASAQAWSADESLLLIAHGCRGHCFLDGRTYAPLFHRRVPGECEWHPIQPQRMICVTGDAVVTWDIRADATTTLWKLPVGYQRPRFGPGKGNLSRDGNRLVLRATTLAGEVAFAVDLVAGQKLADIALGPLTGENSFCSVAPSGRYVFCQQRLTDASNTAYVFSIDGQQLQHWPENHRPGHGDMTIDADGEDIYVGISKADPDRYHVIKRRLRDGAVTSLAPRGAGQHVSARNAALPGWVFVTYSGSAFAASTRDGRTPFYQEVVAIRLDGSGEHRRIAHTRAAKRDYLSEAHATPSPSGKRVIFASNWGNPGQPVASYVATIKPSITAPR